MQCSYRRRLSNDNRRKVPHNLEKGRGRRLVLAPRYLEFGRLGVYVFRLKAACKSAISMARSAAALEYRNRVTTAGAVNMEA